MEMAGKHSDHYFCRCQANIVTTIFIFFEKKEKNEKCLELPDLARKLIRKTFWKFYPPPRIFRFFFEKNEKCLELSDLARKLIRKTFLKPTPPLIPRFFLKKTKNAYFCVCWWLMYAPRKVTTDFTLPPLPSTAKWLIRAVIFARSANLPFLISRALTGYSLKRYNYEIFLNFWPAW